MQSYKRKITYFFQYHNGNVGSTAGFLKLEIRGGTVKVNINIQEPAELPYKGATLYFYHEAGDHLAAIPVDRIESQGGVLTYQKRTSWQQMYDTDRDLYTFDGVAVMYNDSHYYIGDFKDKERKEYPVVIKQKTAKKAEAEPEEKEVPPFRSEKPTKMQGMEEPENPVSHEKSWETAEPERPEKREKAWETAEPERSEKHEKAWETTESERPEKNEKAKGMTEPERSTAQQEEEFYRCESCPYMEKRKEQQEYADAFEKMLAEYPKLPMYGVTELFDCVRIHPRDIGKLDMRNWKLGVNSFLTHGYYTYQYLLLGKMRFGKGEERPIIGVPGVYSNREKYLANMFGFEQFIPVKKTGIKTGEFGYWIVEISPYL